jgi:hypothetical protein
MQLLYACSVVGIRSAVARCCIPSGKGPYHRSPCIPYAGVKPRKLTKLQAKLPLAPDSSSDTSGLVVTVELRCCKPTHLMLQRAYARDLRFPMNGGPGWCSSYLRAQHGYMSLTSDALGARPMYDVRPYWRYHQLNHERKVRKEGKSTSLSRHRCF